jgi:hypothetical protein
VINLVVRMGQIASSSVMVTVIPHGFNTGVTSALKVGMAAAVLSVSPTVAVYGVLSDLFLTLDSSLQPGTTTYCHFDYIDYVSITQGLVVDGQTVLCSTPVQDSNERAKIQITRLSVSLDKVINQRNLLITFLRIFPTVFYKVLQILTFVIYLAILR